MTGYCQHCGKAPVVRRVTVQPYHVDLALCDCDFARCPYPGCRKVMRDLPVPSHKCPHCAGRL